MNARGAGGTSVDHRDREVHTLTWLHNAAVHGFAEAEVGRLEHPHAGAGGLLLSVPVKVGAVNDHTAGTGGHGRGNGEALALPRFQVKALVEVLTVQASRQHISQLYPSGGAAARVGDGHGKVHGVAWLHHVFVYGLGQFQLSWLEHPHRGWSGEFLSVPVDFGGVGKHTLRAVGNGGRDGEGFGFVWFKVKGFRKTRTRQTNR